MDSQRPRAGLPHTPWRFAVAPAVGALAALLPALAAGCSRSAPNDAPAAEPAGRSVRVVNPTTNTIRREVGQPGYIQAYERTPIVSKIPGYILKWHVDLGDAVKKDQVLAELWVPEMVSELKLKEEKVEQARKALAMAQAQVATAKAHVQEVVAGLSRAEENRNYWKSQSARFANLVKDSVIDRQSQEEAFNQYRSASAALEEAKAKIESAKAAQQEKESARDKAEVDIRAADAARQQQADLVGYATLKAPYDGVVTQRNNNLSTGQFVHPATGAQADVLYVVERTDTVRIYVSVPETDADWVHVGTAATIRVQALQGQEFKGEVTRTAWSLNNVTRTLLAEIDLENPELPKVGRRLRPGLYAYAIVEAEWPDVLTVPATAVLTEGDVNVGYKHYCFIVEDGRVKRTQIEIGARNDQLVEVLKKRAPETGTEKGPRWEPFTGKEEVVRGDLSGLKDGQEVEVSRPGK
jgi:HlyD family secretion protein